MTNQLASLEQRDYFYLDPFSSVNLGTYIIKTVTISDKHFGGFLLRSILLLYVLAAQINRKIESDIAGIQRAP